MTCYHPLDAWQCNDGEVVFNKPKYHLKRKLKLACGQCIGCKLERARQRAVRCMHEAQMHNENSFITLTYEEEHLPERNQLKHKDFQDFMKRLRKGNEHKTIRYYMGGEYGEQNGRPHYHAGIFNHDFKDKLYFKKTESGEKIYTSKELEKLWPWGYSSVANVTMESMGYIARYCLKKMTGQNAEDHYKRYDHIGEYQQIPEYNTMSLKPGLGATWLEKYKTDIYNFDYIITNGHKTRVPKYYDTIKGRENPQFMEKLKKEREKEAEKYLNDQTPERLKVKQTVTIARLASLKRGKI